MCDEIICRCEEVYRDQIEAALADGAMSMDELKRFTRAGMGLCQGRTCRKLVEGILSKTTNTPLSDIEPSSYRQPIRPVPCELIKDHNINLKETNNE